MRTIKDANPYTIAAGFDAQSDRMLWEMDERQRRSEARAEWIEDRIVDALADEDEWTDQSFRFNWSDELNEVQRMIAQAVYKHDDADLLKHAKAFGNWMLAELSKVVEKDAD